MAISALTGLDIRRMVATVATPLNRLSESLKAEKDDICETGAFGGGKVWRSSFVAFILVGLADVIQFGRCAIGPEWLMRRYRERRLG